MKHVRLILFVSFLLNTTYLSGQITHELKIDFPGFLHKNYIPQYEVLFTDKIGLEIGIGFNLNDFSLTSFDVTPDLEVTNLEHFYFAAKRFNPSMGGKYYFKGKTKYGRGFYIGPYFELNYLLSRDPAYLIKWKEIYPTLSLTEKEISNQGLRRTYIGLHGGYKWIIKNRFVVEIVMKMTVENAVTHTQGGFDGELNIFAGYRF